MIPYHASSEKILDQFVDAVKGQKLWSERSSLNNTINPFMLYITKNIPFYKNSLRTSKVTDVFNSFPLVSKKDILNDYDKFISTSISKDCVKESCSTGTTSLPIKVIRDFESWYSTNYAIFNEVLTYANIKINLKPGQLGAVVLNDNPDRFPSTVINPSLNRSIMHQLILGKGENEDLKLIKILHDQHIPVLHGRPRTLMRLMQLDQEVKSNNRISPNTIFVSGDTLYSDFRKKLESWFLCKVSNVYSLEEGGPVGLECQHKKGIHVLLDRIKLEVLLNNGSIESTGEGELVITNINNWAMAFIRYRTGDYGKVIRDRCKCGYKGQTILNLSGRDIPYFIISSRLVNPSILNPIFEKLPIKEFQIIQNKDFTFIIKWVPSSISIDNNEVHQKLLLECSRKLGNMQIQSIQVDSIGKNGMKVQRFVRVI